MHPTRMDFQTTADIVRKVLDIPELTPGLLTASSLSETLDEYREVSARGRKRDEIKATVETGFTKEILEINATQMLAEWNRVSAQWFLPRYFGQKKIKKAINLYALKSVKPEAVKPLLHQIIHYQEEAEFVRKHADRLPSLFGGFGKSEDWSTIEQIINDMGVLHSLLLNYSKNIAQRITLLLKPVTN